MLMDEQYVSSSSSRISRNLALTFDTFLLGDRISFISLSFFIFFVFIFSLQMLRIA
jgi:hypothetical protein